VSADAREAFEVWFASVYGPPPSDAQIMASLAEAARLEAFMGGAWAAWQRCHAYLGLSPDDRRDPGALVEGNMTPAEADASAAAKIGIAAQAIDLDSLGEPP